METERKSLRLLMIHESSRKRTHVVSPKCFQVLSKRAFLKYTDYADFTDFHGKDHKKSVFDRAIRKIRVQKELKKQSLRDLSRTITKFIYNL